MHHFLYRRIWKGGFAIADSLVRRRWVPALFVVCTLFIGVGVFADPKPESDDEALRLGRQVLAVRAALDEPAVPGAMQAVMDLGLDSRYYVMVRGWLSMQLAGDRSIADASKSKVSPKIERRIEFLEQAIRAIDLE